MKNGQLLDEVSVGFAFSGSSNGKNRLKRGMEFG